MADITKNVENSVEAAQGIETGLNQMKAAQQATHDLNAANRAAQEEAGIAAQMQPIDQTVDFLNLYNQRQAAEYAKEKEQEQKRLSRERLGHDIASIAASIGDMTRASEGAPVAPRDWQRIYDNLTAQEKANIDNYRVRMAKIHEDEKAARMAQAQAKAKAIGDKQKQDYDLKKLMIELGWKGDQASFERAKDILLKMLGDQTQLEGIKYKTDHTPRQGKSASNIRAFGSTYFIDASQYNATMDSVFNMLENMGVHFGIKPEIVGVDRTNEKIARAGQALESATLDSSHKDKQGRSMWRITYLNTPTYITEDQKNQIDGYIKQVTQHRETTSSKGAGDMNLESAEDWFK